MRLSLCRILLQTCGIFALGLSCSTSDSAGITVRVRLQPVSDASAPLITDSGYTVTLVHGYLVTAAADLEPCGADVLRDIEHSLSFVRTAHAHEPGTPTHIGSPHVEPLVGAGTTAIDYGTFSPPPDRYCTLHYDIGPADADADGLPADPDMVGKSLYVEGTYAGADGVAHPFTASTAATATADLDLPPLDLQRARAAYIDVRKSAVHWFDGIDFATATPDDIATTMLANVGASVSATVE